MGIELYLRVPPRSNPKELSLWIATRISTVSFHLHTFFLTEDDPRHPQGHNYCYLHVPDDLRLAYSVISILDRQMFNNQIILCDFSKHQRADFCAYYDIPAGELPDMDADYIDPNGRPPVIQNPIMGKLQVHQEDNTIHVYTPSTMHTCCLPRADFNLDDAEVYANQPDLPATYIAPIICNQRGPTRVPPAPADVNYSPYFQQGRYGADRNYQGTHSSSRVPVYSDTLEDLYQRRRQHATPPASRMSPGSTLQGGPHTMDPQKMCKACGGQGPFKQGCPANLYYPGSSPAWGRAYGCKEGQGH